MSAISTRLPPIHCLLAFEARARLKSGVLVAKELNITPSAVTHRIRQLEGFTSLTLFTKVGGNVVLTPDGQSYLETVRGALYALSYFSARARPEKLRLRLSSPPTFAARILIPRLEKIRIQFPALQIDIQLSVPLIGAKAEPADIDFRFGDGNYPGRTVIKVLDEKVVAVCHPEFAQKHGPFKRSSDLRSEHLLRCSIDPWRPWFLAAGLDWSEPDSTFAFSDVGLFADAAAHQAGIGLVRPSLVQEYFDSGRLCVLLPSIMAAPYYAYYATCTPESHQRPDVEQFIQWLAQDLYDPGSRYRMPKKPLRKASVG
ncbi:MULTISPECIES: LysR substrate-binding domain-containing protein [unclassified Variovorax]|uniref:LysR substrate-binding domain-containing protein n=1 Tax=unclassified Variovorax TaxID=663243 RepID=UPI0008D6CFDA|nr:MULTISPECIES: LysR substrate-binding domain-containing protein [unclassified Variovorax]SEJ49170.1 DNA-binding transcriptional regulator, LysR family [Variovorax sp. OK202]SFC50746.1 DNA-binding transcriptional regulator, LysR family [Variovorax sp. OK212]